MSRAYDNAADGRYQQGGRRNLIINGNFDVWQRGTSFSSVGNGTYQADRWLIGNVGTGGTVNVTQQAFTVGQTDVPGEPQYYHRTSQTVASSDARDKLGQKIEDVRTAAGEDITITFWAKAGATKEFGIRVTQEFGSGGSSGITHDADKFTVTTSWQKFTIVVSLSSISGKTLGTGHHVFVRIREYSSFSTFDLDVAQFQVERGNVATPFEHRSYGEELALCQRYFHILEAGSGEQEIICNLSSYNSTTVYGAYFYPQVMRTAPTYSVTSSDTDVIIYGNGTTTTTNLNNTLIERIGDRACRWRSGSINVSVGASYWAEFNNSASYKAIKFDAEL